jgi:hypothetical protein
LAFASPKFIGTNHHIRDPGQFGSRLGLVELEGFQVEPSFVAEGVASVSSLR